MVTVEYTGLVYVEAYVRAVGLHVDPVVQDVVSFGFEIVEGSPYPAGPRACVAGLDPDFETHPE